MNCDDRQYFHLLFFISVTEEIGCQKSLPTFYQAMTFNTLYPHKCELFREKKTKVPSTVALLSPAAYRHQSHPRDTNSTLVWQEQSPEVEKLKIWIFKKMEIMLRVCLTVSNMMSRVIFFLHSWVRLENAGTVFKKAWFSPFPLSPLCDTKYLNLIEHHSNQTIVLEVLSVLKVF